MNIENKENWMISDLHIHSKYSRATSPNLNFENLVKWAKIKGMHLLGTGDFSHPTWFNEIKDKLADNGKGMYFYQDFPFIITGEISLVYTKGKGRRIHLVLLIPGMEIAEKINSYLDTKGRRDYDGRPIFNISGEDFVREIKAISDDIEIIPAHIWTSWFGLFGSNSGFDSLKECFGEQAEHIHAIETGMSSSPLMNWKISELNEKAIISFSDSHSFWPYRLGREATIFKKTNSYKELIRQIREKDFIATIETEPAYGKYHYDGHRLCNFSCSFEETKRLNGICPVCGKPLTIGVEYRVEELKNQDIERNLFRKNFYKLLPLHELIALNSNAGIESKKTWEIYNKLIEKFENEFNILLNVSKDEFIREKIDDKLIELILRNREGKIRVKAGFDGKYGIPMLEEKQKKLF